MVIGQYRILEKIGEGGMGVIYKAEHCTLEQTVAIKSLPGTLSVNAELRERFVREAKIQAKLSHPNVVNILNFFEFESDCYIVMEYVEGETLQSLIRSKGLIPPDTCIQMFKQMLAGIGYAHSKEIIHRDVKPSNIIIKPDGTVKITDFGIAKISGDMQVTKTGVKVGTLWYMSPEQVRGEPAGAQADIYALGVTLFEMLTGKVPFTGDSEYSTMKNIVELPAPSPRDFYPYVPLTLERTILKALAKDPADRFQTIDEFETALVAVEELSLGPAASAVSAVEKETPVSAAPRPGRTGAMAAAGLSVAVGLLLFLFMRTGHDSGRTFPAPADTAPGAVEARSVPAVSREVRPTRVPAAAGQPSQAGAAPLNESQENREARNGMEEARQGLTRQRDAKVADLLSSAHAAHGKGDYGQAIKLYKKALALESQNKSAVKGIKDALTARKAEKALGLQ